MLLDYSAAFDTTNLGVFFKRLQDGYGIGGTVLKWFMCYLKDRLQAVVIEKSLQTRFHCLEYSARFSKGPLDFIMYTGLLSDVISAHKGIRHIIYTWL